ncbi:MAG: methyltransferase domain-containing protein [Rhodanobacter sp.]
MFQCDNDIYATAPLRGLLSAQTEFAAESLKSCSGVHGLMVSVAGGQRTPALLHVGHWVELRICGDRFEGALRAELKEALPFVDEAFDVVVMQHVLQSEASAAGLLLDAVRVLAPGGMLVISGIHPLGAWAPWFLWKSRHQQQRLDLPLHLLHLVRSAGLAPVRCSRVGTLWPSLSAVHGMTRVRPWGGGYVLLARKSRHIITPLRIKPIPSRLPANGRLSPGTRRNAALTTMDYVKNDE